MLSRMSGMCMGMNLGWFLLFLLLGVLLLGFLLTKFGLFGVGMLNWVYFGHIPELEGPTQAGSNFAFPGKNQMRIRSRRLGSRAVGGRGSSKLYRVSQGDEVDKHCAQYFVNTSLASVLFFN